MRYFFKEDLHLLYATGALYDSNDNPVYSYENETLLFPRIAVRRYDEEIGYVKKNFTLFLRQYDIVLGDQLIDSLQQRFRLFTPELVLENLGWRIEGDFLALEYQIYDENNNLIAEVSQELFHLTKHYYVEIYDESQEELLILLVIAINQFDKDLTAANSAAAHSSSHN